MKQPILLLSCEHAGNHIPEEWKKKITIPKEVLNSHRGWDPGALQLAVGMAEAGAKETFVCESTRLLIELNRSIGHRKHFSEFGEHLTRADRKLLIDTLYLPYRKRVTQAIEHYLQKGLSVWHVSVHTFTPVLDGDVRKAEIGLLYDPRRLNEKLFAVRWQKLLRTHLGTSYRVRMNYPYRGIADGFVTALRKLFPTDAYMGMELEVNQGLLDKREAWGTVKETLTATMAAMLKEG